MSVAEDWLKSIDTVVALITSKCFGEMCPCGSRKFASNTGVRFGPWLPSRTIDALPRKNSMPLYFM